MPGGIVSRFLLVATLSLGVLVMHGLAVAHHGMGGGAGVMAMASDAPITRVPAIAEVQLATGGHVGALCLWVLVAAVAVAAASSARRRRCGDTVERLRSTVCAGRALPGPAPPSPRSLEMLGVLLR